MIVTVVVFVFVILFKAPKKKKCRPLWTRANGGPQLFIPEAPNGDSILPHDQTFPAPPE